MKAKQVIGGGLLAGVAFYALSLLIWALFNFLPVVPLPIAVPQAGLGHLWQVEHLLVSLIIGLLWSIGYAVYGVRRPGGWLYGLILYLVGTLPGFIVNFLLGSSLRSVIVYGAIVSLVGALLGGKTISLVQKK